MSVKLSGIVMQYPGTRALDNVDADFLFSEVHGLIGENGAGKTTLLSILGGSRQPTSGTLTVDGVETVLTGAGDALRKGIAHVSQEGSLVPSLSGAQNILLGDEPRFGFGVIRTGELGRRAAALMTRWFPEVAIDLDAPVETLPMADQKVIEIVRALRGDIRLLILDEPTATLPAREKENLWRIIRSLPPRGVGVVLVSHFLSEVKALSDRITVLRDGRHITTCPAASVTEADLVDFMLQRNASTDAAGAGGAAARKPGATVLELTDWRVGRIAVDRFSIRAGEIIGLIGLTGAGHFGFARSLYTGAGLVAGETRFRGEPIGRHDARSMKARGVAFIPDHRMENSLIGEWDVRENLAMVHPARGAYGGSGVIAPSREERHARAAMQLFNVKAHSTAQKVQDLSGGNKQKVSIGKWLYGAAERYNLMIFVEPTEGVDIGAKREIHRHLARMASEGAAIIVASSDLMEIAEVSDRAIPFVDGRAGPAIGREQFSEARFIAAMAGAAPGGNSGAVAAVVPGVVQ